MDWEDGYRRTEIRMKDNTFQGLNMVEEYINGRMDQFFKDYLPEEKE